MRPVLSILAVTTALLWTGVSPLGAQAAGAKRPGGRPLTSVELLLKLYHGSPAAAAAAVKVRGTAFDLTPPLERLLVEAGADRSLLALATLRRVDFAPAAAAAPRQEAPVRMYSDVQARKLIQRPEAAMPPGAAGGKVTVEIVVGADGRVKTARTLNGDAALTAAALEAARGYVYRPTVLDGEAVEVITEVAIEFSGAGR